MGVEVSRDLANLNFEIPSSLRTVAPFLQIAQKFVVYAYRPEKPQLLENVKRVIIAAVNHSFKMVFLLSVELDTPAKICLENYRRVRDRFQHELGIPKNQSVEYLPQHMDAATLEMRSRLMALSPHSPEMILAEADEVLSLAEVLNREGFIDVAADQYHTASVYYRVMESITKVTPDSPLHQRLVYSAWQARQGAKLEENIAGEFFTGKSCADLYEINGNNRLGKGSYGSVYLANHRVTNDDMAVKVMNVDRVTSYYLRKLHTEISILRCLDHPNIVGLQDVFYGKRSVYLVTHLCRGGELFELLNTGKSKGFVFKEDRAAILVRDMLSAVHYLHLNHIVHRDLKLENFLFELKHVDSPLVLIDFGLARRFEPGERMNQRVGSCYYTAPEVLAGDYDHTCDVWSVGVLLYMLLSGSPPFAGRTPDDVYESIQTQEAVYPEKKFGHLSSYCQDFLKRLLVKNPAERMGSAEALHHPYIRLHCQNSWAPFNTIMSPKRINRIVESIILFLNMDPMTKLMLYIVTHSLPTEQITDLRFDFYSMDIRHCGSISRNEFVQTLCSAQAVKEGRINLITAHQILCHLSGKESLELSYRVFLSALIPNRLHLSHERIKLVFQMLDPDQIGFLNIDGVGKFAGLSLPSVHIKQMIDITLKSTVAPTNVTIPSSSKQFMTDVASPPRSEASGHRRDTSDFFTKLNPEYFQNVGTTDTSESNESYSQGISSKVFSSSNGEMDESMFQITEDQFIYHLSKAGICHPPAHMIHQPLSPPPSSYHRSTHSFTQPPVHTQQPIYQDGGSGSPLRSISRKTLATAETYISNSSNSPTRTQNGHYNRNNNNNNDYTDNGMNIDETNISGLIQNRQVDFNAVTNDDRMPM